MNRTLLQLSVDLKTDLRTLSRSVSTSKWPFITFLSPFMSSQTVLVITVFIWLIFKKVIVLCIKEEFSKRPRTGTFEGVTFMCAYSFN